MNYLTSEQNNPVENLIEVYNSDYCITLDELPDLKTYPISGEGTPKTTTSSVTSAVTTTAATAVTSSKDFKMGDVNCDGTEDMSDVVLLMQSLANPDKYGANGTDKNHITAQGQLNGDADKTSNGLTSNDALEIQRYLLGLAKWD
jgi:mannan endo-1,4-beta-mannosidase